MLMYTIMNERLVGVRLDEFIPIHQTLVPLNFHFVQYRKVGSCVFIYLFYLFILV